MTSTPGRKTLIVVAAIVAGAFAALGAAWASGSATSVTAATPAARPEQVTVLAHAHSYSVQGLDALHAGLVQLTVRDVSGLPHGAGFVRLHQGVSARRAARMLEADRLPAHLPFTLLGGIPQLQPGGSWQATIEFRPGRYAMFDDGAHRRGMLRSFSVGAATGAHAAAPHTVGTIGMRDFAFDIHLPDGWNGHGVVAVPNNGHQLHELTLIRMSSRAEERKLTAELRKGYPSGPEPKGITFVQGGASPGQTAYVRLDLKPGRYLAVCLMPDPKTGKPHTALGMLSTLTIR